MNDIPAPSLSTSTDQPAPGDVVSLAVYLQPDMDHCSADGCSFSGGYAMNQVSITGWSDGGAGGQFGYTDSAGQFQQSSDPNSVTSYRCSSSGGTVTLTLTVDDLPGATDPYTGSLVTTNDDAPATTTHTLTVTAPPPHVHQWNAVSDIPPPQFMVYSYQSPESGSVVPLSLQIQSDHDQCNNYYTCPFPYGQAENQVVVTTWSDAGAGGQFGYLDAGGQFQVAQDPSQVTHYRCPTVSGMDTSVTLSVTVDDVPMVTDPSTGASTATYDDQPVSAAQTFTVLAPHQHNWEPINNIPPPTINVSPSAVLPGQLVSVNASSNYGEEMDHCLNPRCPFPDGWVMNQVVVTAWSDGGAGGQFGYLDGTGTFAPSTDPAQITYYRTPANSGTVTISVTVDDLPEATDPITGAIVSTYDDAPVSASAPVAVGNGHEHQWQPLDNIPAPRVQIGGYGAVPGQVVSVTAYCDADTDYCMNYASPCSFNYYATNQVQIVGWSDGGAGGAFGYIDEMGQFVASTDPARITAYQCPSGSPSITLTATADDIPQATDPLTGSMVATYDDAPVTGSASLAISMPHTHNWEAVNNLYPPSVSTNNNTPAPGSVVPLFAYYQRDQDRCLNPGCPFYGGMADNEVRPTAWSDGGVGGQFGYLDGAGQFVAATDPLQVTHYLCPPSAGSVTLTLTVDDVPQAVEPGTGITVSTYDDSPASGSCVLSVTSYNNHVHQWEAVNDIPAPWIGTENDSPVPGQLIRISCQLSQDQDHCLNSGCSFYMNTATNDVQLTGWSDGGAGGQFGYLDEMGQFVTSADPTRITHYQCPTVSGTVTLSASADDLPQAVDPVTQAVIATYDDAPSTGSHIITIADQDVHNHDWQDQSNLPTPSVQLDTDTGAPGDVIPVTVPPVVDNDLCLDSDQLPCAFPQDIAQNNVVVTGWSDGGAGGTFGYLDSMGQFVPSTDPSQISHYQLPAVAPPPGGAARSRTVSMTARGRRPSLQPPSGAVPITLSVTIDDLPQATEVGTGRNVLTYDDSPATATATVYSYPTPPPHVHNWAKEQPIPPVDFDMVTDQSDPHKASAGSVVQIAPYKSWHYSGGTNLDRDECTNYTSQMPCPFQTSFYDTTNNLVTKNWAWNKVQVTSWDDGQAGGKFGWMSGSNFVSAPLPIDWSKVTSYQCPTPQGGAGAQITLSVKVDDDPHATEPSGNVVTTAKDDTATGTWQITIPGHQHVWDGVQNLPQPRLQLTAPGDPTTLQSTAQAGGILGLNAQVQKVVNGVQQWVKVSDGSDTDFCTASGCTFDGNTAKNQMRITKWSDGGLGGTFGVYNPSSQRFSPAGSFDSVNAYQCPVPPPSQSQNFRITITVEVDDINTGVLDRYGNSVTTFDDAKKTDQQTLTLNPAGHTHTWRTTPDKKQDQKVDVSDESGTAVTTAYPGALLRLSLEDISPDWDVCTNDDGLCCFSEQFKDDVLNPKGLDWRVAREVASMHTTTQWCDDLGGTFGHLLPDGSFEALDPRSDVKRINYYLVGNHTPSASDGKGHVWVKLLDAGYAMSDQCGLVATLLDGEQDCSKTPFAVAAHGPDVTVERTTEKSANCGCCRTKAPAHSEIDPQTGELSFTVPVTQWTSKATEMGLDLQYNSLSRADPTLDAPELTAIDAQPDFAHLAQRNTHWTHTWAQYLEVVQDGIAGETHALWHTADGGQMTFLGGTGSMNQVTWSSYDSSHWLASSGHAFTTVPVKLQSDGGGGAQVVETFNQPVWVPYGAFDLSDRSGTHFYFDKVVWRKGTRSNGSAVALPYFMLTHVVDRWGRTTRLDWSSDGWLNSVGMDGETRGSLTFTYRPDNRLLDNVVDPLGRKHQFQYLGFPDEAGTTRQKLTSVLVQGPALSVGSTGTTRPQVRWSFDYSVRAGYSGTYTGDLVVSKTEPSGKVVSYRYAPVDPSLRQTAGQGKQWDGVILSTTYHDSVDGYDKPISRRVDSPAFANATEAYVIQYPLGRGIKYEYHGEQLIAVTNLDLGTFEAYDYNSLNDVTKRWTNAEAGAGDGAPDHPLVKIDYDYNSDNSISATHTWLLSGTDKSSYALKVDVNFGAYGVPTEEDITPQDSTAGGKRSTTYKPDASGNITNIDINGDDFNGGRVAQSMKVDYGSKDAPDRPTAVTDVTLGRATTYAYYANGLLMSVISPPNPLALPQYLNVQDPAMKDSQASVTTYVYNADELLQQVLDPLADQTPGSTKTAHTERFGYQLPPSGVAGGWMSMVNTHPDGSTATAVLDVDGNSLKTIDEKGFASYAWYNGEGQPVQASSQVDSTKWRTVCYGYDAAGNLTTLYPGNANPTTSPISSPGWTPNPAYATTFSYSRFAQDGSTDNLAAGSTGREYLGRLTGIAYPDGNREYRGYDDSGRLVWSRRPYASAHGTQQAVTQYSYDYAHRLQQVVVPTSPSGVSGYNIDYAHDALGRIRRATKNGLITTYDYDALGRTRLVTPSDSRQALTVSYESDSVNHRWKIHQQLANGAEWIYGQDAKGRLATVKDPANRFYQFYYDLEGKLRYKQFPNGLQSAYRYDDTVGRHFLFGVDQQRLASPPSVQQFTALQSFGFSYDRAGLLGAESEQWPGVAGSNHSRTFTHDGLGQVVAENSDQYGSVAYSYDSNGNRTQASYTYNGKTSNNYFGVDAADKLQWVNTVKASAPSAGQPKPYAIYTYDAFGQLTQRNSRTDASGPVQVLDFNWDADGRLTEIDRGKKSVLSATYDENGERITQTDAAGASHIYNYGLHDGGTGTQYTPGLSQQSAAGTYFYHQDWLASTRYLSDGNGNLSSKSSVYDAFGQTQVSGDAQKLSDFQFAGGVGYEHEADGSAGVGLFYLSQRYYDPMAGRFITRDPIGLAGGMNLYGYCDNDPVDATDPSGLRYIFEGDPTFQKTAQATLSRIEGSGPTGKKLVSDLRNTPRLVHISPSQMQNNAVTRPLAHPGQSGGVDSRVFFNPNYKSCQVDGAKFDSDITFAHELGHAWQFAYLGLPPAGDGYGEEIGASLIENQIRAESKRSRRPRYGNWPIPAKGNPWVYAEEPKSTPRQKEPGWFEKLLRFFE